MTRNSKQMAQAVMKISQEIRPLLAHRPPEIQSAVLADLTSLWIAGHAPALRQEVFREHVALVYRLICASELEIFGPSGHPSKAKARHE